MKRATSTQQVYHKEYGRGIILRLDGDDIYTIVFERFGKQTDVLRANFFIRGDHIKVPFGCDYQNSRRYEFHAFIDHNPKLKNRFVVTYKETSPHLIRHPRHYSHINDMPEHYQPKPDIEINVKVNGETVRLSDISEETLLNIRRNER